MLIATPIEFSLVVVEYSSLKKPQTPVKRRAFLLVPFNKTTIVLLVIQQFLTADMARESYTSIEDPGSNTKKSLEHPTGGTAKRKYSHSHPQTPSEIVKKSYMEPSANPVHNMHNLKTNKCNARPQEGKPHPQSSRPLSFFLEGRFNTPKTWQESQT